MSARPVDPAEAERRLDRVTARDPLLAELARAAREGGWSVHVVGGYVRDKLLRRSPRDVDLVLGPQPDAPLAWLSARSSHRTITFERRVVNHRLTIGGRIVDVVERGTRRIDDELRRRDFTVNAIGFDLVARHLRDPCHGLSDLAAGTLALAGDDAIRRDPLRALRGVRLAAELASLELAPATEKRLGPDSGGLATVAPERVREELERILFSPVPGRALGRADACGLLAVWLPELAAARGVTQSPPHHLDVHGHTLEALERASRPGRLARGLLPAGWPEVPADPRGPGPERPAAGDARAILLWAIVLHDLGKPRTRRVREDGRITFHGHESAGAEIADAVGRRLLLPSRIRRSVRLLVAQHLRLVVPPEGTLSGRALARIVRAVGPLTELLVVHSLADQAATRGPGWREVRRGLRRTAGLLLAREREMHEAARRGRLLTGRDVMERLGIGEGPRIGELLREADELRDAGTLVTRDDALAWLARRARPGGDG